MSLGDSKTCAAQYVEKLLPLKPCQPHTKIRFVTSCSNPLDIGNIQSGHPPETITRVTTTERNIIHNIPIEINTTIMGGTITGINTADLSNNINSLWYHNSNGYSCNT